MDFDKIVKNRRSIRSYKKTSVPREKIDKILESARLAPSARNLQPWHFIVVEDKEMIKKLAKTSWAETAPLMIVGLADTETSPHLCQNDLGIALEHMVLSAWDLGLGTCWMGQSEREDLLRELLEVPDNLRPIALITVGEAKSVPDAKPRKSMESIVSWEKYGKKPE
ncbi:nitroreductase [Candidatus Bathyarchaeota archaeon]|nr:nitroreductase [Candidatus Bathyarchaeota archaeon]